MNITVLGLASFLLLAVGIPPVGVLDDVEDIGDLLEQAMERFREADMTTAMAETGGDPGHEPARRTRPARPPARARAGTRARLPAGAAHGRTRQTAHGGGQHQDNKTG